MTADLGLPLLHGTAQAAVLARALADLAHHGADRVHDTSEHGWSLELARSLLQLAGLAPLLPDRTLVVHDDSWEIRHSGRPLSLTITQFRLLRELVNADDHTVPTPHLATMLFGSSHHEHHRVAAHVKRLRRRLDEESVVDCHIEAVRGFGYRLAWAA